VNGLTKKLFPGIALFACAAPRSVFACAACYGASDSPLAQGMNWGIMVLLGFVFCVLAAVTGFFIYIIRRANVLAATSPAPASTDSKP
jgi:hypothetical protein